MNPNESPRHDGVRARREAVPEDVPSAVRPELVARQAVYLYPGQIVVCGEPCSVTTILGSCVGVCLWDRRRGVGGMAHYLLPIGGPRSGASGRYGNLALEELVARLLVRGVCPGDLVAKLFGGACVLSTAEPSLDHLGARNVHVAHRILRERGIGIGAEDVGGRRGRKVVFQTDDGVALMRRI